MGRGDSRTRRGKISKGSYGKTRSHSAKKATHVAGKAGAPKAVTAKAVAPKKAPVAKKPKA